MIKILRFTTFVCFLLFLSCGNESQKEVDIPKSHLVNDFDLKQFVQNEFHLDKECMNLVLVLKYDCPSCVEFIEKLSVDPELKDSFYFLAREIREIEKSVYFKSRPYIDSTRTVFSDSAMDNFLAQRNMQLFSGMIAIIRADGSIDLMDDVVDSSLRARLLKNKCDL